MSAAEVAEAAIRRIEATNPALNYLVSECFERALATPAVDGPFTGVPMLVKDLTETAGLRTTYSCRAFADNVPAADAAVVRRMRAAGFTILGKSNTPEFGITSVTESELNGACRNPFDLTRTPGGSSGGAAAAVACGALAVAHGSDGGGSLRIPASCCGLFAIKPSRGRVSSAPGGAGSLELGQNGPLAVSVRDAAALLDVLAGYEPGDAHWAPPPERPFADEVGVDPGRLRIALTTTPALPYDAEPVVVAVARQAADALAGLGHDVVESTPPWRDESVFDAFAVLWQLTPAYYQVEDRSLLTPLNRGLLESAEQAGAIELAFAVRDLLAYARRVVAFWDTVDLVLTPTLGKLPVPIGWVFEPDDPWEQFARGGELTPFTPAINVLGLPAVSVPFGEADGLPVGIQLVGQPAGEALLIRIAAQLEAAYPWAQRLPRSEPGSGEA